MVQVPIKPSQQAPSAVIPNGPALEAWLNDWAQRIIQGDRLTRTEALRLSEITGEENILKLCAAADQIRQACCGNIVDLCSIINVKSGSCSENCSFCSQSAHHPGEDSPVYGLKTAEEILEQAKAAEAAGPNAFAL